jgi:glycosylphosphatidylinositol transamidase (GPIT) subunit GPI8
MPAFPGSVSAEMRAANLALMSCPAASKPASLNCTAVLRGRFFFSLILSQKSRKMANVSVFYQHVKRNQLQCQTGLIDIFRSKPDHISERRIDLN